MLASACGASETGFQPPKVGTEISWKYKSDDGVDDDVYTVVATGPDFTVFKSKSDDLTFYTAEFSGIGFVSCDTYDELPSRYERTALFSAWPPQPGAEFRFDGADIKIVEPDVPSLEVLEDEVFWFEETTEEPDYDGADPYQGQFASSVAYGTVIESRWQDGSHDWVVSFATPETETYEIQPGYEAIKGLDVTAGGIGNCMTLLSEAKPITKAKTD